MIEFPVSPFRQETHGHCLQCWFSALAIYDERWWPQATFYAIGDEEGPCCRFAGGYAGHRHEEAWIDA